MILDSTFWLISFVAVIALSVPRLRRAWTFGAINLVVLALWVGWRIPLAAVGFTVLFWLSLVAALAVRRRLSAPWGRIVVTPVSLLPLCVAGALFLFNKWNQSLALSHAPGGTGPEELLGIAAALGLSYVFLRCCDATHSTVWKGLPLVGPLALSGYLFPFHMLLSGPINRYDEHVGMDRHREAGPCFARWLEIVNHITTGLLYKFVLADYLRTIWFGPGEPLRSAGWADTAVLFAYIFFDFAGYSRIALGIGLALAVPTPQNFRSPFGSSSLTDFFTRWHMSLGTFVQRNIYTPLQLYSVRRWGIRRAGLTSLCALLLAWIFVGLWHRLSIGFLLYGVGMAALVALEKYVRDKALKKPWARTRATAIIVRIAGPAYVFVTMTTVLHFIIAEIVR